MNPLIGITVDCKPDPEDPRTGGLLTLNWNYADEVAKAGGIPILLPPQTDPNELAHLLDGLLIPGGPDIDASRWGEQTHPQAVLAAPERTQFELDLLKATPNEMPVLGICYGCQLMAVAAGGKLDQHLPESLGHDGHAGGALETYCVDEESRLSGVLQGTRPKGKSYHHQGVRDPGAGYRVVAKAEDGTNEAIELESGAWRVGVQWHPERTPELPETQRLFRAFVQAAAEYKRSKA